MKCPFIQYIVKEFAHLYANMVANGLRSSCKCLMLERQTRAETRSCLAIHHRLQLLQVSGLNTRSEFTEISVIESASGCECRLEMVKHDGNMGR